MSNFSNALNDGELERLALLSEEAGELVQTIGKIIRHGFESYNPDRSLDGSNRDQLQREIGDVLYCVQLMEINGDIDRDAIQFDATLAAEKKPEYLHHQSRLPETTGDSGND